MPSPIGYDALARVEHNFRQQLEAQAELFEQKLDTERKLRELTERTGKEALDKASAFITEKTEEHNNLLQQMQVKDATYVTKPDLEKEKIAGRATVLFYISVASAITALVTTVATFLLWTLTKTP